MKTKTILTAGCLLLSTVCTQAQQTTEPKRERAVVETQGDSIIILRGKGDMRIRLYEQQIEDDEQKEVEIFEGVYLEDLSQSWEFGFNILATHYNFKKNPHWGANIGLSWGYRSFSIDGDYALIKQDGISVFHSGREMIDEGSDASTSYYRNSRLRHFFFRIPIQLEWQQRINKGCIFFNFGPEFEIRHNVKSFSHVNGGKKQTVGKGMYVRPVGTNLLLQAGYGNLGVYLRYSMNSFFQTDKGPDMTPYSFGIAWYW